MKNTERKIGIDVKFPEKTCNDKNCIFHGDLLPRGRTFEGIVKIAKMQKTVTVEWERRKKVPKYERYEKRWTKVKAHNPSCISAVEGDIVKLVETRPLSKTKYFVIVEKLGRKDKVQGVDSVRETKHDSVDEDNSGEE